jgi:hypothetical protein
VINYSKTSYYVNALSPSERKELHEFISSPFFNKSKPVIKLYEELLKGSVTDEKKVYQKITGKKYEEQKLRYLLSDLNLLIEDFFSLEKWKKDHSLKKQLLITGLQEKKLFKYIPQHQQTLLEGAERMELQDSDYLGTRVQSEETSFRFASQHDNRAVDSRLQKLSDSIDTYYFAKKLKYACEMINRSNVLQVSYNIQFIEEIRKFLATSGHLKVPAVAAYFHILNTLTEPGDEKHYRQLKQELVASRKLFSNNELKDMFTFAQNYCIRQLNSGKASYLEELFSNYEFLLGEKIIFANGILSQFDFKNIVAIALRLHKYEWVKQFISKYLSYVPEADRRNSEVYNLARLYYATGELKKALKLMQDVEFTDIYYHLDAKALLVKIYYDTNSFESLMPLSVGFNNYLRRNKKVSSYQRLTYQNFVKTAVKMFNYKMFDKGNIGQIRSSLNEAQSIADISWLKQKLGELE